ncbi:hypothetical protein CRE_24895, partial [Caenorhabditis remanei]
MGSTHSAVERGLGALGKLKKKGRWIPHKLSNFDLERQVEMSLQLLTLHPNFNWLDHLSWIKVVTMFDFCNILALNNFDFNNVRKLMGQPNITLWKGNLKNADFKCIISFCPRGLVFEENEVKVWCDRRLLPFLTHFQKMFAVGK